MSDNIEGGQLLSDKIVGYHLLSDNFEGGQLLGSVILESTPVSAARVTP